MGLDPITVTLTSFEKLEILRGELKSREEQLQKVEKELRGAMRSLATYHYLTGISSYYASRPTPPEAASVREVEKRRQALYQVIQEIRAAIPRLEVPVPGQGQPAPRQAGRRSRFA